MFVLLKKSALLNTAGSYQRARTPAGHGACDKDNKNNSKLKAAVQRERVQKETTTQCCKTALVTTRGHTPALTCNKQACCKQTSSDQALICVER